MPPKQGFSITSVDKQIVYLERPQGYYQKTELVLEKVQIPDGKLALLTLTDREGDGICCTEGEGYFQLYSDDGSLILDGAGEFLHNNTVTFTVGNVETLPPTASTPPSVSPKPTFNQFPVSIVLQLDQWSAETGINIQDDKGHTFFNWPPGSFSQHQSSIVKQTVMLPRDAKVSLDITDTGEDGFCCLYGDGWIKVYAGDDADDETALLAFEQARFESEMSIRFRAGPPDFTTSATSSSAVSDSATSGSSISALESNLCKGERGEKCVEITMTLQLDRFSSETSWFISSSDGQTNFIKRPGGYYEQMKEQKVIETVWLPEGEYEFRIIDYMVSGYVRPTKLLVSLQHSNIMFIVCPRVTVSAVGQVKVGTAYTMVMISMTIRHRYCIQMVISGKREYTSLLLRHPSHQEVKVMLCPINLR